MVYVSMHVVCVHVCLYMCGSKCIYHPHLHKYGISWLKTFPVVGVHSNQRLRHPVDPLIQVCHLRCEDSE